MAKKRGISFANGNQLWKLRNDPVKPMRFQTPKDLLDACIEYLTWLESNPLIEEKAFAYQGEVTIARLNKMRMPTFEGLYVFLGIAQETWSNYRKRKQYAPVVEHVTSIIRDTKLTGAAAGLLDSGLIIRDLGLAEKRDLSSTDGTMSPPKIIKLVPKSCE